jgi:hypothetical protein
MKNKPYPALLGDSYLFNEVKKRTPKSRETIPLSSLQNVHVRLTVPSRIANINVALPRIAVELTN